MSYKFTTGSVRRGDIYFEDDDLGSATYIDFGMDTITLRPSGSAQLYVEDEKVGIGTTNPICALDIVGRAVRIRNSNTPSSASDIGAQGEIRWDANYLYVCVAPNTWKRLALNTW